MNQYPGYKHHTSLDMMKEAKHYIEIYPYCNGATVLDIGACIGSFTYQALKAGAKHVTLVEAGPENFAHLSKQPFILKYEDKLKLAHRAVVDDVAPKVITFYEPKGENRGKGTILGRRGYSQSQVKTIGFVELVTRVKPTVLKIDVEGAELDYRLDLIPQCVEAIGIELHSFNSGHKKRYDKARYLIEKLFPDILYEKVHHAGPAETVEIVAVRQDRQLRLCI